MIRMKKVKQVVLKVKRPYAAYAAVTPTVIAGLYKKYTSLSGHTVYAAGCMTSGLPISFPSGSPLRIEELRSDSIRSPRSIDSYNATAQHRHSINTNVPQTQTHHKHHHAILKTLNRHPLQDPCRPRPLCSTSSSRTIHHRLIPPTRLFPDVRHCPVARAETNHDVPTVQYHCAPVPFIHCAADEGLRIRQGKDGALFG